MHYDGGKAGAGVYQQIINQIPPHRVYIEPFAGEAAVYRFKRPGSIAILVEADEEQAERLRACLPAATVMCGDAPAFLRSYPWQGDEFVYLDPPYLLETRSSQRNLYRHEFATTQQHDDLLLLLRQLPCPVALSGYWSQLYAETLSDWRAISFQTVKRSGALATEWLWMNYPAPLELHEYTYLGRNFRERERIKRKRNRWKDRLRHLPDLERHALFAAIEEVRREQLDGIAIDSDGTVGSIAVSSDTSPG